MKKFSNVPFIKLFEMLYIFPISFFFLPFIYFFLMEGSYNYWAWIHSRVCNSLSPYNMALSVIKKKLQMMDLASGSHVFSFAKIKIRVTFPSKDVPQTHFSLGWYDHNRCFLMLFSNLIALFRRPQGGRRGQWPLLEF